MRKLKLQVQLSVDGYVAGTNGEMDWMTWSWDDAIKKYVDDLIDSIDCILLGRKMAEGFITHWSNVIANPTDPEFLFGKKMTDTHKVVFTRTLGKSEWKNTVLAKGNLADEINQLKKQEGKDIIVYGGANFVSNLIQHGLIDELHLFINPAAIGKGMAIFKGKTNLKLIESTSFTCGIVVLKYETFKQ